MKIPDNVEVGDGARAQQVVLQHRGRPDRGQMLHGQAHQRPEALQNLTARPYQGMGKFGTWSCVQGLKPFLSFIRSSSQAKRSGTTRSSTPSLSRPILACTGSRTATWRRARGSRDRSPGSASGNRLTLPLARPSLRRACSEWNVNRLQEWQISWTE